VEESSYRHKVSLSTPRNFVNGKEQKRNKGPMRTASLWRVLSPTKPEVDEARRQKGDSWGAWEDARGRQRTGVEGGGGKRGGKGGGGWV